MALAMSIIMRLRYPEIAFSGSSATISADTSAAIAALLQSVRSQIALGIAADRPGVHLVFSIASGSGMLITLYMAG